MDKNSVVLSIAILFQKRVYMNPSSFFEAKYISFSPLLPKQILCSKRPSMYLIYAPINFRATVVCLSGNLRYLNRVL
ncbi:hypothetical protein KA005_77700, partial [bacterium]|nr:hypothetical protein [bacterium]